MLSCKSYAVIGLGFGDEGKGLVTNALSLETRNSLVVRYSGGQQAGHTVTRKDGVSHVFSNFGSGSFAGAPTYWSKHCTIDPVGIMRELEVLKSKGCTPKLFIGRECPVTTPYDKWQNQRGNAVEHGTCGVGVGTTLQREEDFYSFTAGDLLYPDVVDIKLDLISDYYVISDEGYNEEFKGSVCALLESSCIEIVSSAPLSGSIIFEGSQGLLLDQHNGFFPHVTRSNTGTTNILEWNSDPELYLVTRAYQTRHGNGPMTNENQRHNIIDNPLETNVAHKFQGEFRKSILDLSLLKYGMGRDNGIKNSSKKNLVITCCDHISGDFLYTVNGDLYACATKELFASAVGEYLNVDKVITVDSPDHMLNHYRG